MKELFDRIADRSARVGIIGQAAASPTSATWGGLAWRRRWPAGSAPRPTSRSSAECDAILICVPDAPWARTGSRVLATLRASGAEVAYCDPYFPRTRRTRKHDLGLESVPLQPTAFAGHDAVVVATAHDQFKDPELFRDVALIVDTRNLVSPILSAQAGRPRIVKA